MAHREAFVLHTRSWRDSGLLVDLLLRDQGRVRAVARGVRRKRRGGNPCQLFQPLFVVLSGRSELKTVQHIEACGARYELPGQAMFGGLYANELLVRSLPEAEGNERLFDAYSQLLQQLIRAEHDLEPPLRAFERVLLEALGYAIDFSVDASSGQPLLASASYRFIPEVGFVPVQSEQVPAGGAAFSGRVLLKVARGALDDASSRRCAKRVMRVALRSVIGDQPLHSRLLFAAGSQ